MAIPVVIGVGDVKNKSNKVEDAIEPLQLMLEAIKIALDDTNLSPSAASDLKSDIDSIDVVRSWTWPYPDLPGLISQKLGANPKHQSLSEHGGNQPGKIFDEAARRISLGQSKVAIVTGGEALASLSACAAAKKLPPPGWTKLDQGVDSVFSPTTRELGDSTFSLNPVVKADAMLITSGLGALHSIGAPIHIYPLYENALRAHRGQSIKHNNQESAQLYAEFAKVAEQNPYAWSNDKPAETESSIGTITKKNRMICFPYPLLMNAFNTVNLAAACIITSTEHAEKLGVPKDKWTYPLGAAGTRDSYDFWERPNYHTSPCISNSIDGALQASGLTKDEMDYFDFYSCFPIVPKLACRHVGLSITQPAKPITLLGGLTSFGGAGNNYSLHALTALVRTLRSSPQNSPKNGLVLANGGVATYQHAVVLSTHPRRDSSPYPAHNPIPDVVTEVPIPQVSEQADGEAVIETYTVEFNRDNTPLRGHVVGRLKESGNRFIANHGDSNTLQQLASTSKEPIGRSGWVRHDEDGKGRVRNLFSFETSAKL